MCACRVGLLVCGQDSSHGLTAGCTERWLQDCLLKKLINWSKQEELNTAVTSLKLIPVDVYNAKYQLLKAKYAEDLVKVS